MKRDIENIDRESFMVHSHIIGGECCSLVQPIHIGVKWNLDNLHFRSSVWNSEGELISAGFKKFPNLSENPAVFPVPTNLKGSVITSKLDGSLLIVSKYKGNHILRTRGTINAIPLANGYELEIFKEKYLPILDNRHVSSRDCDRPDDTWTCSYLFEWLTASEDHTIVIKYENVPEWILIGAINHWDYSLFTQAELDDIARISGFKRPDKFEFDTVDELIESVTKWKDQEGVVLYTNRGQTLHKIKSDDYKKKHAFKSNATLENTLELYFTLGKPSFVDFRTKIGELYDWECVQMVLGHISNICDAAKEVQKIIDGMFEFIINTLEPLPTRKDQALKVLSSYGTGSNRSGMVFTLLDGKSLTKDQEIKLFWQVLKK